MLHAAGLDVQLLQEVLQLGPQVFIHSGFWFRSMRTNWIGPRGRNSCAASSSSVALKRFTTAPCRRLQVTHRASVWLELWNGTTKPELWPSSALEAISLMNIMKLQRFRSCSTNSPWPEPETQQNRGKKQTGFCSRRNQNQNQRLVQLSRSPETSGELPPEQREKRAGASVQTPGNKKNLLLSQNGGKFSATAAKRQKVKE